MSRLFKGLRRTNSVRRSYFFQLLALFLTLLFILAVPKVFAENQPDPTKILLSRILSKTPILNDLQELTDTIGGRPTGSLAMARAEDWAVERFNEAGLENVHTEEYIPPANWLPHTEQGEVIILSDKEAPRHKKLRVAEMPFSQPTPPEGLEASVYNIGTGDEAAFAAAGERVRGKWLLVINPLMKTLDDLSNEYTIKKDIFKRAKESGAAGVLWLSSRPGRLLYRHNLTSNGYLGLLPGAVIERRGGEQLVRLLKKGVDVRVKLNLQHELQENPVNANVVAEIKGWERPEEVIILGAHLDSWDLGDGALDNGCNAVLTIDAARQMMKLAKEGHRPRRTLRFVLYSGEELGLYGSWFDAQNHAKELDRIKAVIIYDLGTGRTTGFSLGGRYDMAKSTEQALAPISYLGPFKQTFDAAMDTDNFDYLLQGIPTLVANQDDKPYLESYHAESDTFDKIDKSHLKLNTAIASVLLWNFANDVELAPRQNYEQLMALLKHTKLDEDMKNAEVWEDFLAGHRGLAQNAN